MLGDHVDILLQGLDIVATGLFREPAAQGFERPDVADAGRLLDRGMNIRDRLQGLRRIERGALGKFDQDVDWIGAGQLGVKTPAGLHRLLFVRHLIGKPVARLQIGVDNGETADKQHRNQTEQPGTADHAHRDPVAKIAQHLHAGIGALELNRENSFVAYKQHPEHRHQREHRNQRDDGGGKSRLAEFADQLGIRKLQGNKRYACSAVCEHAGRPDHEHGVPECGVLVLARDQTVARRKRQLHRVRKADHHDQRRHHVQEHVEVEIGPSEAAKRQQDRDDRREGGDDHERYLAEEDDRDDAASQNSEDVVGQPVTLYRVADFELHDGHAR